MGWFRKERSAEDAAGAAYGRFEDLARRYCCTISRRTVTPQGKPMMLFLGNHSSGKSTLINWLLGGDPVQDVGVAPTDDGFTVISWGETNEDMSGPAALEKLPGEFKSFAAFGPGFLSHLKLKLRNRSLLKDVLLIDSPGMIDSASGTAQRDYDFTEAVRMFAELCDMIYFLFDPDKPGTTGETVDVFANCLRGKEFKLRVLMNKCDSFSSMYDFARCYGTLCWNLARVLSTKDLPKLLTVYSGDVRTAPSGMDYTDFERDRKDLQETFATARNHRHDNILAQALNDFTRLSIRMSVLNRVWRSLLATKVFLTIFGLGATGAATFAAHTLAASHGETVAWIAGGLAFAVSAVCAICFGIGSVSVRRWMLSRKADEIFEKEYRRTLAQPLHDDIRRYWEDIREETAKLIRSAPLDLPIFGEFKRRQVVRAAASLQAG